MNIRRGRESKWPWIRYHVLNEVSAGARSVQGYKTGNRCQTPRPKPNSLPIVLKMICRLAPLRSGMMAVWERRVTVFLARVNHADFHYHWLLA
jgi:hypothetical protein